MKRPLLMALALVLITSWTAIGQDATPADSNDYSKEWNDKTLSEIVVDLRADLGVPITIVGSWEKIPNLKYWWS
ncbi:MAG: hypothetical protein VCD00_04370 [Candidatus Hydrogenedentota bacterium]